MSDIDMRLDRALAPVEAPPALRRRLAMIPLEVEQERPSWLLRHVRGMVLGGGVASLVSCLLLGLWLGSGQLPIDGHAAIDEPSLAELFLGLDLGTGLDDEGGP